MRVALGADHAGFELKELVKRSLAELGHQVIDLGTDSTAPVDYPDFAAAGGQAVIAQRAERGIVICGSGVGAAIAANKIPGIRAGLCHDHYSAHQGVEHDDMNVLCLGSKIVGPDLALDLILAFLAARFSGAERHLRRLSKVRALEQRFSRDG
jgi:RpiB/LacA/LacB family sugar-phosphate isomerase